MLPGCVAKTGFVEQRSFSYVHRNFNWLWVFLILFLQSVVVIAWEGTSTPWGALSRCDVQVGVLTLFITWAGLQFIHSLLDAGTQDSRALRDTMLLRVRMVLKSIVATGWTVAFCVLYIRIWSQRNHDGRWSAEANCRLVTFLEAISVFGLWFCLPSSCSITSSRSSPWSSQPKLFEAPGKINFKWHEIFSNINRFVVGLSRFPVGLAYLMDCRYGTQFIRPWLGLRLVCYHTCVRFGTSSSSG
ncbi:callose synthase 11-like [Macadamia integrifolia]|uniref:callose synthase 11-like n=1 Tax=Macadamia integrifolia TaxID=60698 RepID=UPI001C501D5A|nr:callose synthase 11-like [Macadamia integrifolia]